MPKNSDGPRDAAVQATLGATSPTGPLSKEAYRREIMRLGSELVRLQEWVRREGHRVVVIFEGRDAAGKGGVIKRIAGAVNPRFCRIAALDKPTERERTQWYFQRYVAHLPAAGEIVLFDRSWYNRAGVERVMGYCTDAEYREFLRSCPEFERMLMRSGIILLKYWFSISAEKQEERFRARIGNPSKRWKLSEMDIEARRRWWEFARAKDDMFVYTDIEQAPWFVVEADDKRRARLNCIRHLLDQIPYVHYPVEKIDLPPVQSNGGYVRPPKTAQNLVPDYY